MMDVFGPNQRIIMLQAMYNDNDYSLSNEMLQRVLNMFGHGIGLERTNEQIHWLENRGLVTVEDIGSELLVVRLTRRGKDVAEGHERVDGVDRPRLE